MYGKCSSSGGTDSQVFIVEHYVIICYFPSGSSCQDKVLKDMDEQEEMKTCSSSEEESDETDDEVENERRLQRALLEKDKVSFGFLQSRVKTCAHKFT